jgi:hypothetical protein
MKMGSIDLPMAERLIEAFRKHRDLSPVALHDDHLCANPAPHTLSDCDQSERYTQADAEQGARPLIDRIWDGKLFKSRLSPQCHTQKDTVKVRIGERS